ncbi:hypothetical protein SKAU_G00358500 [Synaphobranchus kaupii]|uniref:Uncharacterized protein n=1 Tax=Synaphobranchus kaupii TaxID=118154 RepID=A0A9Q1EHS8_SYNKA|nr:hypothetical protein SKAU_G00358500 [Synaphobranchus kaupii]
MRGSFAPLVASSSSFELSFRMPRTHLQGFLPSKVLLFHTLLFGADFVEEYLLQPFPGTYTHAKALEVRQRARKLDTTTARGNVFQQYTVNTPQARSRQDIFLLVLAFSGPDNAHRREAIRRTRTHVQEFLIRTLFVLGSPRSISTQDTVRFIFQANETGFAGVVPTHSARFFGERHIRYNACCYQFIFSSANVGHDQLDSIWQDLRDERSCSLLETYYGLVACKALTYLDKFSFFNTGTIRDADSNG